MNQKNIPTPPPKSLQANADSLERHLDAIDVFKKYGLPCHFTFCELKRLQEAEDVLRRGLTRTKLRTPLNYMEVGQCCAARYCQLIHRGGEELKYGTLFLPRPPLYWRETGKTNYEELVAAARDRLKYAAVAFRFAVQLQPFVLNVRALVSGALVYEEIYHYEPGPAARTAASASESNPAVDKDRQDEIDAICEQMGELGELSDVQQLK